jgi:NADP-dependent 3-hydroxy acid dehydrogenase YdfG
MQRSSKSELRRAYNRKTRTSLEIVVITGASAGLGRAAVRAFARRGAHIGLVARGQDGLEEPVRTSRLWGARH